MPVISAHRRLREADSCKSKARLAYRMRLGSQRKKQQKVHLLFSAMILFLDNPREKKIQVQTKLYYSSQSF